MLNNNFLEFVSLLAAAKVKYLIVGGYAVGFHGYPRYTGDIDIFVEVSPSNAKKLVKVFSQFGFPNTVEEKYFLEKDSNIAIGQPPQRIHILTGIAGVTFAQCYQAKEVLSLQGLKIPFIGLNELIKAKSALMRDQDRLDIKELQKLKKK